MQNDFFKSPAPLSLSEIASEASFEVPEGKESETISLVGPIEAATKGFLTFLDNTQYLPALAETKAKAVICKAQFASKVPQGVICLVSKDPYRSFAAAMAMLFPQAMRPLPVLSEDGVSSRAIIDPGAAVEDGAHIEAGAVIGAGAQIGSGAHIAPGAVIGANVSIGRRTSIASNATILHAHVGDDVIIHAGARIGSDGYGFAMGPGGHLKVPQIGRVIVQDKVEIGAGTCIDRGANRDTVIGEGTKIDDQVMIGHNVEVGRHCILVAQVGIAGSAKLGDFVALGGKVAVVGHVTIGPGAQIAGGSGVGENVPPGAVWGGTPARPVQHWLEEMAAIRKAARRKSSRKSGGGR
ncbi:MAG: UDP-3-O-(3-hydroxymyristoyl)glucosamine N-acyltransferase [Pseudomonadota bacterium]